MQQQQKIVQRSTQTSRCSTPVTLDRQLMSKAADVVVSLALADQELLLAA
jgi:hypothetical protein